MCIMYSWDQILQHKIVRLVKVLWQHQGLEETTREREDMIRANYHFLFKDEGTWYSHWVIKLLVCMHVIMYICLIMRLCASVREFRD